MCGYYTVSIKSRIESWSVIVCSEPGGRHFALTVPLSTQVYQHMKCLGNSPLE